jgi:hypothetical protein
MHCAAVPENEVARLDANLDPFTAAVVEPLMLVVREAVKVLRAPCTGLFTAEHVKELPHESRRALQNHEATVILSTVIEVDKPLETVESPATRGLIHVFPYWLAIADA